MIIEPVVKIEGISCVRAPFMRFKAFFLANEKVESEYRYGEIFQANVIRKSARYQLPCTSDWPESLCVYVYMCLHVTALIYHRLVLSLSLCVSLSLSNGYPRCSLLIRRVNLFRARYKLPRASHPGGTGTPVYLRELINAASHKIKRGFCRARRFSASS